MSARPVIVCKGYTSPSEAAYRYMPFIQSFIVHAPHPNLKSVLRGWDGHASERVNDALVLILLGTEIQ